MRDALPLERSESAFADLKLPLLPDAAVVEANRCLFCSDAPCTAACPTHIDVPQFIRKIATGNLRGSARTIFEANVLGMSCARVCPVEVLCVGACVYNDLEQPPIAIGRLQRHATDAAYAAGWRFFEPGPPTGRRVALLGAGPASLAAAHELRRLGHACTILEKREVVGGLNTTGVAPYKMKAEHALDEAAWILSIGGIDVRLGVEVGADLSVTELERDFDAVFVGVGLGTDGRLAIPGESLDGVHGAVEWIERMKLGRHDLSQVGHAVVVGGGNTAIDAVREARGLGLERVTMLYRGSSDVMSGYAHEWRTALSEGARAEWHSVATAFEPSPDGARVARVRATRVDAARRPIEGSSFAVEADLVLLAIGQSRLGGLFGGLEGIALDHGRIATDADGCTGRRGWYAGGDCANGGREVVYAAAEGKRAAQAIDRDLREGRSLRG